MWLLPDQARAKAFVKGLLRRGLPGAQMYRGEPVYWNPAVLARRTALGETGSWEAERGMLPTSEALVARNVIVPVGVRYTPEGCDRLAEGIRAAAEEALA